MEPGAVITLDIILAVLGVVGSAGTMIYFGLRREARHAAKLAHRLELLPTPGKLGKRFGFEVSLSVRQSGSDDDHRSIADFEVDSCGHFPGTVQVHRWSALPDAKLRAVVRTCDNDFDSVVRVGGHERLLIAALNSEERSRILQLSAFASIDGGYIRGRVETSSGDIYSVVERHIQIALLAARNIAVRAPDVPMALASNAKSDPVDGVRANNTRVLLTHYKAGPEAESIRTWAKNDTSPAVQFELAIDRRDVDAVLRVIRDDTLKYFERNRAIEALTKIAERDQAIHALRPMLDEFDLRGAASRALARLGDIQSLPSVIDYLRSTGGIEALPIVRALEHIDASTAEDGLLAALHHRDADVRATALDALHRVGTPRSIQAISQSPESSAKTKRAIAAIRARIDPSKVGALALAEDQESGKLSEAPDDEGALSPPED